MPKIQILVNFCSNVVKMFFTVTSVGFLVQRRRGEHRNLHCCQDQLFVCQISTNLSGSADFLLLLSADHAFSREVKGFNLPAVRALGLLARLAVGITSAATVTQLRRVPTIFIFSFYVLRSVWQGAREGVVGRAVVVVCT